MDKIYSRKRFPKISFLHIQNKLPKGTEENKKIRKIIKIIIILIIAILVVKRSFESVEPILNKQCIDIAKSIATQISNNEATAVMRNYKYEDLTTITKDSDGNITMIKANIIPVNEIISDIAVRIQEQLDSTESDTFNIRLGSFTGSKILSGRGPKIPIKMATMGNVETDLRSEFTSAGINQTLHRIYLQLDCKVTILTPIHSIEENISNQVLLAEAVIVGQIPNTYYNLEGLEKGNLIDVIE